GSSPPGSPNIGIASKTIRASSALSLAVLNWEPQVWQVPFSRPAVPIRAVSMPLVHRKTLPFFQTFQCLQRPSQLAQLRSYRLTLLARALPCLALLRLSSPKPLGCALMISVSPQGKVAPAFAAVGDFRRRLLAVRLVQCRRVFRLHWLQRRADPFQVFRQSLSPTPTNGSVLQRNHPFPLPSNARGRPSSHALSSPRPGH